jgi:predicted ester cyclase
VTQSVEEVARERMERINADDWDGARALHADDASEVDMISGQRWQGADKIIAGYRGFKKAFPDLHATVNAAHVDGSHVALEIALDGTQTGPMKMGGGEEDLAPTHRKIHELVCDVLKIQNGKIVQIRVYHSHDDLLRQLGVKE